ncbi:MAG TPA: efflux RND transporter periplasmic adaptor subunit [candidate division Zixibacteria bacterium]|nr:efflux RND transporter periplasmic adaptor subunit [candidate division Zixibacteria bacterium]MDD4917916.1 efflux RND transporter periplasmic adaptor subunit [candidate division Zixibacteria bacterium]MDM7972532.1 efflux RND transporter periplasmic adaptor subunit [candidate division Zixibacteria bacterium]HOD65213.1 efflux RND transporter periplasmic adaptor subunit [candidate division Zixibacteria bacterium]HOZ08430.1 efflux RND transporter periplasmic adaptor subunit [candidate division Z
MVKKVFLITFIVVIVGGVLFFAIDGSAKKEEGLKTVPVERGDIIDKALAVGRIVPEKEIAVKSKISGIVKRRYVDVGETVAVGDPLFDIAPDPTPLEFAESKRQVELAQVTFDNAKREFDRTQSLKDKQLISNQEFDKARAAYEEAELRLKLAEERLSLIQSGRTTVADLQVDNTIKAPISGTVLSILVEEGDPVVPLTSYQAGTELMTIARMDNLVFKGDVDEIDVGKLHEDMGAEIEVGALPNSKVTGRLTKISPKASQKEGSTLFEVEIALGEVSDTFLRAGYSANADIIITKKEGILTVPERLVKTEDSVSTVEVQDTLGVVTKREVKTGLSDGIKIEITDGLEEGELLVERPPREITGD